MPLAPCPTPETVCLSVCLHSPASNYDLAEGKMVQLAAADVASLNALKLSKVEHGAFFSLRYWQENSFTLKESRLVLFCEIQSKAESRRFPLLKGVQHLHMQNSGDALEVMMQYQVWW